MTSRPPLLPPALILGLGLLPALLALPATVTTRAGPAALGLWLGWLGAGLLAANLLLMVREPALANRFGGLDRMYRWHHGLGTLAYLALLAHPLLLAAASLPGEPGAAWRRLAPLSQPWPVLLGWVALLGLMAGLAATFAVRLRYALWRALHLGLGLAVLLGMVHVLAMTGWSLPAALAAAPVVLALAWRLMRADRGLGTRPYEVAAVHHPSPATTEAILRPLARSLPALPGHFVMAAFFQGPRYQGSGEFHPYTVIHRAADGSLTLAIKALGDATRALQDLRPGVAVRLQGPYRSFMEDRPESAEIWLAGGIGITPFLAALHRGRLTRPTELVYVYREPGDAPYVDQLRAFAADQPLLGLHLLAMGEDPAPLLAMLAEIPDLDNRQVYLCGPPPLVDAVGDWLRHRGCPEERIHFERFDLR